MQPRHNSFPHPGDVNDEARDQSRFLSPEDPFESVVKGVHIGVMATKIVDIV